MTNIHETNIRAYSDEKALEKYSTYELYPNEQYCFDTYFKKGESVLDLACGSGRTTVNLSQQGYRVKGVDLSVPLIEAAQKKLPTIEFEVGDYSDIKEQEGSYDNIFISHNGIDHAYPMEQREKVLSECHRVLRPGGYLIFSSHNIRSLFFSHYYFRYRKIWMLKHLKLAFKPYACIFDPIGIWVVHCSPRFCITQAEKKGFQHIETIGYKGSKSALFINSISPYNHYVFKKKLIDEV